MCSIGYKLYNKAASDHDGTETIFMPRNQHFLGTGNSLMDKGKTVTSRSIECARIDTELPDIAPTLVKIDVEGHELACLKGMCVPLGIAFRARLQIAAASPERITG